MNVLMILGVLFLALIVVIPLVERFGKKYSAEEVSKISRWVMPLMGLLLLIQGLRYLFG